MGENFLGSKKDNNNDYNMEMLRKLTDDETEYTIPFVGFWLVSDASLQQLSFVMYLVRVYVLGALNISLPSPSRRHQFPSLSMNQLLKNSRGILGTTLVTIGILTAEAPSHATR